MKGSPNGLPFFVLHCQYMEICKICQKECKGIVGLYTHVKLAHKLTKAEYGGKTCKCCDAFVNLDKDYCKEHANEARREWNKENSNFDPANMKGKKNPAVSKMMSKNNTFKNMSSKKRRAAKQKSIETRRKNSYNKLSRMIAGNKGIELLTPCADYTHVGRICLRCLSCQEEYERYVSNAKVSANDCRKCNPVSSSKGEIELMDFIKEIYTGEILNRHIGLFDDRREVDCYLPELKIAVEYNGLYWHSETMKGKDYHEKKRIDLLSKGIRLVHIYEDDWNDKTQICKSMISYLLNKIDKKVYPRKCEIIEDHDKEKVVKFFEDNHISGNVGFSKSFVLIHEGEIVAGLSLRKPWQDKESIEIARFAIKTNITVPGAFTKLLKQVVEFSKKEKYKKILTYSHNSHGTGSLYKNSGFTYVSETPIEYWYTNYKRRFSRQTFKAKNGLSEAKVSEENKVVKIYGCTSSKWEMTI